MKNQEKMAKMTNLFDIKILFPIFSQIIYIRNFLITLQFNLSP